MEELPSADSSTLSVSPDAGASVSSPIRELGAYQLRPLTNMGQAYYWSRVWQMGEQETLHEYTAGGGVTFENPDDAVRYLLSTDD